MSRRHAAEKREILPDAEVGWNGARSKCLGAAMLIPILRHVESGRAG